MNNWHWPDARGWIGIGAFVLTVIVLTVMVIFPDIRNDEFFKVVATLIVGSYVKDVVAWAYASTKGGGELADKNAAIVAESATASVSTATKLAETVSVTPASAPLPVEVVNTPANPANVTEAAPVDDAGLPAGLR